MANEANDPMSAWKARQRLSSVERASRVNAAMAQKAAAAASPAASPRGMKASSSAPQLKVQQLAEVPTFEARQSLERLGSVESLGFTPDELACISRYL